MKTLAPDTPVQYLKGVGPARARQLERLNVRTAGDLLRLLPRKYDDYSQLVPLTDLRADVSCSFRAEVVAVQESRPRPKLTILQVLVRDATGNALLVWFNQPFRKRHLQPGLSFVFSGQPTYRGGRLQVANPEYEPVGGLHTGRIVPVYPAVEGLKSRQILEWVAQVLPLAERLADPIPADLGERLALPAAPQAWRDVHAPPDWPSLKAARRRLAFEELLVLLTGVDMLRRKVSEVPRVTFYEPPGRLTRAFFDQLPFTLTGAQQRVVAEIGDDLVAGHPMNRLLQGDVGSGKTVVAAWAMLRAIESGHQAAMMAPTEILAAQHAERIGPWFDALGVRTALLTGATDKASREHILADLASGEVGAVLGTHALLEDRVQFRDLALVVTDEQHRFGVRQRARLSAKGSDPDLLVTTATPIPRTLAFILYGDLDLSVIDERPPGRLPVRTHWRRDDARPAIYKWLGEQVRAGRQAYVVCPLVEESEQVEARAATEWAERVQREFPDLRVGLLHGRLRPKEKTAVMKGFASGRIQILVTTTVIEVGVDVANASIMVIEGAERFGLAQLHQLRGRVGRGKDRSHCVLIADPHSEDGLARMRVMQEEDDGFRIAEEDLRLRGPGEVLGTRQHGVLDLMVADVVRDKALVQQAREAAQRILARDPELVAPEHRALRERVLAGFGEQLERAMVN